MGLRQGGEISPDAEATFHRASCTLGNQVVLLRTALHFVRSAVRLVYAERIARVGTPNVKATLQPNESQIEVNTAPRKPEGWQRYFNKKVKKFGVYVVYYSGVDRDGITSFAASEDLQRVVKVIDIALEYATTTTRPTYCLGLGGSATQSIKAQRPRSDKPTSTNAQRSSPSRMTPERDRRPRSGNEKRPSRRI